MAKSYQTLKVHNIADTKTVKIKKEEAKSSTTLPLEDVATILELLKCLPNHRVVS